MNFILLIIILVVVITTLLFVHTLRINFVFDTDKTDMNMTLLWLYPLIKIIVTMEDAKPALSFYFFNKHIFKKTIKKGRNRSSGMDLIKITNPKDICITANYGFRDTFTTGITCGAINIASQLINIESIKHNPDFTTENDYIYLDATATINLGTAFINLLRQTLNRRNLLWIRTQT